jgi:hypothetical protein
LKFCKKLALDNLKAVDFTDEDIIGTDPALLEIESVIKAVSLTPKQRQTYGRVAYGMEVRTDKAFNCMRQSSRTVPPYINGRTHVGHSRTPLTKCCEKMLISYL